MDQSVCGTLAPVLGSAIFVCGWSAGDLKCGLLSMRAYFSLVSERLIQIYVSVDYNMAGGDLRCTPTGDRVVNDPANASNVRLAHRRAADGSSGAERTHVRDTAGWQRVTLTRTNKDQWEDHP